MVKRGSILLPTNEERDATLRRFQQERTHIWPYTLTQVPEEIAAIFPHPWSPVEWLMVYFALFPTRLLQFWLRQPGGHVVIGPAISVYRPGPYRFHRQVFYGVLQLDVRLLTAPQEAPVCWLGRLLDSLLGSGAVPEGRLFSSGGLVHPALAEAYHRFRRQSQLGYLNAEGPGELFAQALAFYWRDRRELNIVAPDLERLFRDVILSESFWARLLAAG